MRAVRDFERVVAWSRTPGRAGAELADVEVAATAEDAVRAADVVVTATSASEPIVRREWLRPGVHINAVGSAFPNVRELDSATVHDAAFFVDRRESALNEAGDFLFPLRGRSDLRGPHQGRARRRADRRRTGRQTDEELTVFESLGLAVEDLVAAEHVVARANAENVGALVSL